MLVVKGDPFSPGRQGTPAQDLHQDGQDGTQGWGQRARGAKPDRIVCGRMHIEPLFSASEASFSDCPLRSKTWTTECTPVKQGCKGLPDVYVAMKTRRRVYNGSAKRSLQTG
ncbi:MAG: hypothetical protein AMXMBFR13_10050 [Phycisphaerae bacterium]